MQMDGKFIEYVMSQLFPDSADDTAVVTFESLLSWLTPSEVKFSLGMCLLPVI